jgi:hypothetical protein
MSLNNLFQKMKKFNPTWLLLIVILAAASAVVGAYIAVMILTRPTLQDIQLSYNPDPVSLFHIPASTTVTLTSRNGISGNLNLSATWGRLNPVVSPTTVYLPPGGIATATVTLSYAIYNGPIEFNVLVPGLGTKGFLLDVMTNSSLALQSYSFASATNATMTLYNFQGFLIRPLSYVVADGVGDQYTLNYSSMGPNCCASGSVTALQVLIGANCPSCTLKGAAFMFTTGNSYTVTLLTSPNYQFIYTIRR